MTICQLVVVVLIILGAVSILINATRAWKEGRDRDLARAAAERAAQQALDLEPVPVAQTPAVQQPEP